MDLSKFRTSVAATEDGVTVDIGEGTRVTVARASNPKHQKELQRITKPFLRQYQSRTVSDEIVMEHSLQAFVGTVLLNWTGLTIDGVEVPYSREKALEILRDPQYKDFRVLLESLADEQELFRAETIAETTKN